MLLLLLLLASGAAAEPSHEWLTFRDPDAGFVIDLPESPVRTRSSQLTPAGRVHTDLIVAFLQQTEFRVEVHGIPAVARWIVSEQGLLQRAARDLLSDEGATNAEQSSVQAGEHAARRVVYRDAAGRPGEALLILADGRLYLLSILWPLDDRERAGRERFFDSFALDRARHRLGDDAPRSLLRGSRPSRRRSI